MNEDLLTAVDNQIADFNTDPQGAPGANAAPEAPAMPENPLEQLAMDEPIFTGGPTRAEIEAIKAKFPQAKVMCTLLADGTGIVWRTMTRLDWRKVQELVRNIADPDKREEVIFTKVTLFPDLSDASKVGDLPAGAVNSVMNEFYLYSGFQPVAESIRL